MQCSVEKGCRNQKIVEQTIIKAFVKQKTYRICTSSLPMNLYFSSFFIHSLTRKDHSGRSMTAYENCHHGIYYQKRIFGRRLLCCFSGDRLNFYEAFCSSNGCYDSILFILRASNPSFLEGRSKIVTYRPAQHH